MSTKPDTVIASKGLLRLLLMFGIRRRWQCGLVLILTLMGGMAELVSVGAVIPFLQLIAAPDDLDRLRWARPAVDWIRSVYRGDLVLAAALLLIVAAALSAALRLLLIWATSRFVYGLTHDLAMMVYSRVIRQPYSTYVQRNSSAVLAGMEKVNTVGGYLLNALLTALSSLIIAVGIVGLLVVVDPWVAIVAGGCVLLTYAAIGAVSRSALIRLGRRQASLTTERVKLMQETLGGVRDIILDRSHLAFEWQYRTRDSESRRLAARTNFISLAPRFVVEALGICLIAMFAVYHTTQPGGVLTAIPVLGALALGAQRLLPLAQNINTGWAYYAGTTGLVEDVLDLLDAPILNVPFDRREPAQPMCSDIELRGVGYRYDATHVALAYIDLKIVKGSRIGIVGRTGSGKTTLVDILMGLLVPSEGQVLIDGKVLDDRGRDNWQAQIAHVPQSIFLLDDSIANNIAFGLPGGAVDMNRVFDAARRAAIAEFIENLPERYQTRVGERGIRLSGGQRQRLGIARALYKQATVLVLDEATSALDDTTESAVMAGIKALEREMTVLMVAHRMSTLASCDHIVRLEHGCIVDRGSYNHVVGAYRAAPPEADA